MGKTGLPQSENTTQSTLPPTTTTVPPKVEAAKTGVELEPIFTPIPLAVPNWLQYCQAIAFFFSCLALLTSILESDSSEFLIGDGRIFIVIIIIYFGIQLYAIRKFGFKQSFLFLDKLIQFFFSRRR